MATYLPLGVGPAEMELLLKHGIKYDKRQNGSCWRLIMTKPGRY